MTNFKNPNEISKEMDFYSYEELKLFILQEEDLPYKCLFEILFYCGLRIGEANALNWKDINFEDTTISLNKNLSEKIKGERYIILPPKTKSSYRVVTMPDVLINDLKELKKKWQEYHNFEEDWFVFGGIYPLSNSVIQRHQIKDETKANLRHIRIHDFRHSFTSLLINNGASIVLVSKFLGHKNVSTTLNTYSHLYKNQFSEITNTINNLEKNTKSVGKSVGKKN